MDSLIETIRPYLPFLALALGGVLLIFGHRLYWLAAGAATFWVGLRAADNLLDLSVRMEVVAAAAAAVVVGGFAMIRPRPAVRVGSFLIGAILVYQVAQPWAKELDTGIWWLALLGGVFGMLFSVVVVDMALIAASAVVGATLVANGLPLTREWTTWVFLGLVAVGVVVQAWDRKRRPPKETS